MTECRVCSAPLRTEGAQERGCCDVPHQASVEEQMGFWLIHDPDTCCEHCDSPACERRPQH